MSVDKKSQILKAAEECFISYGYEKTTMSDIGSRVGMNKASLYYHFKDKLSLFTEMVDKNRAVYWTKLNDLLNNVENNKDKLSIFICNEIDFIEELALNFMTITPGSKKETESVYEKIIVEDLKWLTEYFTKFKKLNNIDPAELASTFLTAARGLIVINCPLDAGTKDRHAGYDKIRAQVNILAEVFIMGLK